MARTEQDTAAEVAVSEDVAPRPAEAPVPGMVRLMTAEPLVMPASAAAGQSSLVERLDERPWLLAIGFLAVPALFLLLRARRRAR